MFFFFKKRVDIVVRFLVLRVEYTVNVKHIVEQKEGWGKTGLGFNFKLSTGLTRPVRTTQGVFFSILFLLRKASFRISYEMVPCAVFTQR